MAYATKYYDYQIAIIFAILLGGMFLLALVIGAIYFICVVNMRGKKGRQMPGAQIGPGGRMQWQQQQPQQYVQPHQQYAPEDTGYPGGQQQFQPQPQYSYPPQQYDQSPTSGSGGVRVRELQPEYFQQQGPITYTTMQPYEQQQQQQGYPPPPPTGVVSASYHMSSV